MKEKKKLGLGVWIMIGLAAGIAFGAILWAAMGAEAATDFTASYLKPFGDIFVNLLKFIVVPLVLLSIMDGMFSMGDIGKVGKIGWKTVVYFLATTAVACVIGLVVANLFKGSFPVLSLAEDAAYEAKESDIMTTIKNIFPSNSVQPMIDASMLQIIVIALLFGCGVLVAGEKGKPFATFISSFNEVTQTVMSFILRVSPIGVFCLMIWVVAAQGPKILGSLGLVLLAAYIGYIIHTVLDVKVGSGAFMKTLDDARKLAENMVAIGKACGRNVRAVLSNMDVPLGMAIGNALEVQEAAEILQGRGCEDLRGVCMTLAANMVELCNGWDEDFAKQQVHEAVASGKAFEQMKRWIAAQGGDASVLEDFSKLPQASTVHEILAPQDGWISRMDTQKVGEASSILGAGRMTKEDTIDFAAGIVLSKKTGDFAKKGDVLARLYTNKPEAIAESEAMFLRALCWSEEQPAPETLIFDIIR